MVLAVGWLAVVAIGCVSAAVIAAWNNEIVRVVLIGLVAPVAFIGVVAAISAALDYISRDRSRR